jgi:NAD(P)-dependent dehydrogenase (short-subunit alcohol dehydrogenase family)
MSLDGKVAVVTGGAAGIGATISRILADRGARVARFDIVQPEDPSIGELFVECDVTSQDSWASAVEEVNDNMGDISILFLNAGVMSRPAEASIADNPLDLAGTPAYHRVFDVNNTGLVYGLQAALESLRASGDGRVVATASTAGITGLGIDPYYSMSKHAVIGFVRSFAQFLEPQGVKIHAICPGGVKTAIVPLDMAEIAKDFMEPEALAEAAISLLELDGNGEIWVKDQQDEPMWKVEEPTPALGT